MKPKIAICISTYNRPDVIARAMPFHKLYLPPDAQIFVVDDGSDNKPDHSIFAGVNVCYMTQNHGIAATKNKCLELAMNWGADCIFLFDDDCWPIVDEWWIPYVEHPELHLMYQFPLPGKPKTDLREVYRDAATVAYTHTRGAMLYVHKMVVERLGGFDTRYGLGGFEHPDYTNRIHNYGLTSFRAMDVPNSKELLYCLDQDGAVKSSWQGKGNYRLYNQQRKSKEFKEYR